MSIVLISMAAILTSCASPNALMSSNADGSMFEPVMHPEPSKALLYIYRPAQFASGAAAPWITINGVRAVHLRNGGYSAAALEPGGFVIQTQRSSSWQGGDSMYWLIAKPGRTYYLRFLPGFGGLFSSQIDRVSEEVGSREIATTRSLRSEESTFVGRGWTSQQRDRLNAQPDP